MAGGNGGDEHHEATITTEARLRLPSRPPEEVAQASRQDAQGFGSDYPAQRGSWGGRGRSRGYYRRNNSNRGGYRPHGNDSNNSVDQSLQRIDSRESGWQGEQQQRRPVAPQQMGRGRGSYGYSNNISNNHNNAYQASRGSSRGRRGRGTSYPTPRPWRQPRNFYEDYQGATNSSSQTGYPPSEQGSWTGGQAVDTQISEGPHTASLTWDQSAMSPQPTEEQQLEKNPLEQRQLQLPHPPLSSPSPAVTACSLPNIGSLSLSPSMRAKKAAPNEVKISSPALSPIVRSPVNSLDVAASTPSLHHSEPDTPLIRHPETGPLDRPASHRYPPHHDWQRPRPPSSPRNAHSQASDTFTTWYPVPLFHPLPPPPPRPYHDQHDPYREQLHPSRFPLHLPPPPPLFPHDMTVSGLHLQHPHLPMSPPPQPGALVPAWHPIPYLVYWGPERLGAHPCFYDVPMFAENA